MITLLKKEIKDVIYNYKSWLVLLISVFLPCIMKYKKMESDSWIYIFMVIIAICQYIYDSYLTDTKTKGIIFIYNMGFSSFYIFIIKIIVTISIIGIIFLIDISYVKEYIASINIIWILFFSITCIALMQFLAIFSQSSETTSSIITTIIAFLYGLLLWNIDLIILKIGISLASAILMSFIAIKTADSLIYRQQL